MVDCSGFIQPLNLQCMLVNVFAGSMEIFIFLALITIAGLGAYFKMLNSTLLIMFAVFGIVMAQYLQGVYFLVVLIGGLVAAYSLSKIVKN